MKRIVSLCLFFLAAFVLFSAESLPSPDGWVTDKASLIDSGTEQQISRISQSLKEASGAELTVCTVTDLERYGYGSIEDFSLALAEKWQPGEEGKDNGLILILTMEERLVRIEVGYGLEGVLTDGTAGALIDNVMMPYLKQGNFNLAFLNTAGATANTVAEGLGVTLKNVSVRTAPSGSSRRSSGAGFGNIIWILFVLLFGGGRLFWPFMFMGSFRRRSRGFYGGGFGSSRGGFSSGGFSSGGFGGFGGGGFGGGGASRGF